MAQSPVDCSNIGAPAQSVMAVDYAPYPAPLPAVLSQGETEYLSALNTPFQSLPANTQASTRARWQKIITALFDGSLPGSFTGTFSEPSFDDLRVKTPEMLARLVSCGGTWDARLEYVADIPLKSRGDAE